MMTLTRLALLVSSVLVCSTAYADPRDPPATQTARQHFEIGVRLFKAKAFGAAIEEYKAGAKLEGAPVFYFALGQCYRMLNDYDNALSYFKLFITVGQPTGAVRSGVEDLIAQILTEQRLRTQSLAPGSKLLVFRVRGNESKRLTMAMMPNDRIFDGAGLAVGHFDAKSRVVTVGEVQIPLDVVVREQTDNYVSLELPVGTWQIRVAVNGDITMNGDPWGRVEGFSATTQAWQRLEALFAALPLIPPPTQHDSAVNPADWLGWSFVGTGTIAIGVSGLLFYQAAQLSNQADTEPVMDARQHLYDRSATRNLTAIIVGAGGVVLTSIGIIRLVHGHNTSATIGVAGNSLYIAGHF